MVRSVILLTTLKFNVWQFPTLTWETPHYHRRYGVSLLSSAWGQVGPPRYCRQTNSVCSRLVFSSLNQNLNLKQAACPSPFGFSLLENNSISLKHLRCCQVKPHGSLVLVSSTYRYAYTPTYQRLSLKRSFRTLKGQGRLISRQVSRLDAFSGYLFRT